MTTNRKIVANRRNAGRSTGPRSRAGKQRSARNAVKHGLSISVQYDPHLSEEARALAHRIAGENEHLLELAAAIAEAEVQILRVRRFRAQFIDAALRDLANPRPAERSRKADSRKSAVAERTKRRSDCPTNENMKDAEDQAQFSRELARFDRYERRALSRRKFAVRHFDEARAQDGSKVLRL